MPNHITNIVTVHGERDEIARMRSEIEFVEKEDRAPIDFAKVVPQADDLNITSDGLVMMLENQFSRHATMSKLIERIEKADLETVENFAKGVVNLKKYGHASWYNWNTSNWGTKWNGYDQTDIGPNSFKFDTAWNHPTPIFEALIEKYPKLEFEVKYADEDIGNNLGHIIYGKVATRSVPVENPIKFACQIKEWDYDEYIKETEEES